MTESGFSCLLKFRCACVMLVLAVSNNLTSALPFERAENGWLINAKKMFGMSMLKFHKQQRLI